MLRSIVRRVVSPLRRHVLLILAALIGPTALELMEWTHPFITGLI
jgi:hypothetical protein